MFAGEALVALELFDVRGVFDLLGAVERARMDGEHGAGIEDAHGLEGGWKGGRRWTTATRAGKSLH